VIGQGREASFNLNCLAGPVDLRENHGFSRREIAKIEIGLTEHLEELRRRWEEIHGIA
jgi:hypothetical protein